MSTATDKTVTVRFDPTSTSQQADIINGATVNKAGVMTAAQSALLAFLAAGSGGAVFIFRPGASAPLPPGVFNNWAELSAAVSAAQGLRTLEFDDTIVSPCVVPAGTWDQSGVTWSVGVTSPVAVSVVEGAILPGLRRFSNQITVTFTGTTPPVSDFATLPFPGDVVLFRDGARIQCSGAGPFFGVTQPVTIQIALATGAVLQTGATPIVDLVAGAILLLLVLDVATVSDNTVSGAVGSLVLNGIGVSSGTISETQPAFLGANLPLVLTVGRYSVNGTPLTGNTPVSSNSVVRCNPTGGPFSVIFPPAFNRRGETIVVKNVSASANAITVSPTGGDTIDGAPTGTVAAARGSKTYVSDGISDWMLTAVV